MDTTMEFDDMKAAWQTLDRRLEQQHALNLQLFRDSRADKARSGLRPLFWGQITQILFGVLMILLGVSVWSSHREVTHLLISGIIVHVYGVVAIVLAGVTLGMIQRLDYSAPVLTIQKQLAQLRSFYIRNGMIVGLSWWVFWIPSWPPSLPGWPESIFLQPWTVRSAGALQSGSPDCSVPGLSIAGLSAAGAPVYLR